MGTEAAPLRSGIHHFPQFAPHALAAFSGREFNAAEDLALFLESLGIESGALATVDQVHGDSVVVAGRERKGECGPADALVTRERRLALVIRTADCVPLFILDPETGAAGLAHVGWRGAKRGIVRRTFEVLQGEFGVKAKRCRAAMGPSIRQSCYEVGREFMEYFPGSVREESDKFFFDLAGWVKKEVRGLGVSGGSIIDSNLCTVCSKEQFFSARREGQETGRLISLIMLE
jgi:hypothetical protein